MIGRSGLRYGGLFHLRRQLDCLAGDRENAATPMMEQAITDVCLSLRKLRVLRGSTFPLVTFAVDLKLNAIALFRSRPDREFRLGCA